MVKKIAQLMGSEIRGLHEAAYLLGAFAVLSQLLALVRDRLLASTFGAGPVLDVYYASFRVPDIIFVSVASLVSVYVLIPFISERAERGKGEERKFLNSIFSAFTGGILLVSAIVFVFIPHLVQVIFPGFAGAPLYDELILLSRIMLLQPILLGLSNLFGSVTQTHGRFILYALSPLLYNFGIIAGVLFLYPMLGLAGLAWGVVLGALFHLLIQMPFIVKAGFAPRITIPDWSEVKRVITISLPRTLALSSQQIALLVLIGMASVLAAGSIAVFNLAFNLQSVPLSIIAVSYSVAAFPTLARLFTSGERHAFLEQIISAARHIIFWSIPAVVLFVVLRAQIVRVILGAGEFDWAETRLVAAALAIFSLSLLAQGLMLLFTRGYYAAGNTKTPLFINVGGAVLTVIAAFGALKLFEMSPLFRERIGALLRVEDLPAIEILMLPLGYSFALLLTMLVMWTKFELDFNPKLGRITTTLLQSLVGALLMGTVAYQLLNILDDIFNLNTFIGVFLQGLLAGLGGIMVGVLLLWFLKNEEIHEIGKTLHHRFWRSKTVSPEQESL